MCVLKAEKARMSLDLFIYNAFDCNVGRSDDAIYVALRMFVLASVLAGTWGVDRSGL